MKITSTLLILTGIFVSTQINAEVDSTHKATVYKNPDCGCCIKWISYLERKGYEVKAINTRNISKEKKRLGVPMKYSSCHTAIIDGYIIEGHVPDRDIQRLLLIRPDVAGISVPGMPVGTPGMEHGNHRQPYNVMSFDKKGNVKIFSRHDK